MKYEPFLRENLLKKGSPSKGIHLIISTALLVISFWLMAEAA